RHLVADASGAVLADLDPRKSREVDAASGGDHCACEVDRLLRAHSLEDDGHEQGGGLVVGPSTSGDAVHEGVDGLAGQDLAVALRADDVDGAHWAGGSITYGERG